MIERVTDTSLKRRFIGAMALYLIISLILGTYALSINRQQNESLDWSGQMFAAYESVQVAQTELSNARRGARAFLLYGDSAGLAQYQAGQARYQEELAEAGAIFRSLVRDDSELLTQLDLLNQNIAAWVEQDVDPSIALRQRWSGDRQSLQEASLAWAQSPENSAYFIAVTGDFGVLTNLARNALVSEVEEVGNQNTLLTRILIGTLVAMTTFAIIGTVLLYREIAHPLERLARAARGIEGGDFSSRAGITRRNEIGVAARAFDAMAERVQGLVVDLTAAQEEIAEREARLRAILENVGDALISIDLNGRITMLNRRNRERFGIGEQELLGRTVDEAAAEFRRVFTDVDPLLGAIQAPEESELAARSVLLEQYWPVEREYRLVVLPVTEDDGEVIGKLCVLRDVSAERAADRLKSDFVALVSHELRTPLTSIKGYVELLLEDEFGSVPEEQKEILGIISESAMRLVTLTNDLLDISRIEAGRLDVRPVPLQAAASIRRVVETLRAQIKGKEQRLSVEIPPDLPLIQADPNRFTQVMMNLVSNAHKYTPAGGEITIRARPDGDAVRFEVEDNGVGLSEDEQSRLFSRFYRVQNRMTQAESGTGLGLAISKSLIEAQGGTIGVSSQPGEGSIFFFTLPVSEQAPGQEVDGEDPAGSAGAVPPDQDVARRILVVEDEPEIAALIEFYLRRAGYQTRATGSVTDAITIAREWRPDLVTLDIELADGDGFEVLAALRQLPETSSIPALFVSVKAEGEGGQVFGGVDHLAKPINERSLSERIASLLGTGRAQSILVVDDDPAIRGYLRERLARLGYAVIEAANGAEALDRLAETAVALALIDVNLPVMPGVETLRGLRSNADTAGIPVIMMTASASAAAGNAAAIEQLGALLLNGKDLSAEALARLIADRLLPADHPAETAEDAAPSLV